MVPTAPSLLEGLFVFHVFAVVVVNIHGIECSKMGGLQIQIKIAFQSLCRVQNSVIDCENKCICASQFL
jgi:hypothetical protein